MTTDNGHRFFSAAYSWLSAPLEWAWLSRRRRHALAGLTGEVLEIGAGTGANLGHYPESVSRLVLVEPDPYMRARLGERLTRAERAAEVSDAPAERLGFPDTSFDAVVCTLVLCSVADPAAAMAEVHRVLRPGGTLLFLEHVRSGGRMALWQDRVDRHWARAFGGCHLNRDSMAAIQGAGLAIDQVERFRPLVMLPVATPVIVGTARRVDQAGA